MSSYPGWLQKLFTKLAAEGLKKQALDKLPEDELNGVIPGMNPGVDPNAGMPPVEEIPPQPSPEVSNNVFEVDINGLTFQVQLIPELVMKDTGAEAPAGTATGDPMADTTYNPNADPQALAAWMEDPNNEKSFNHEEQGTVDPLSQEDQGIAVHDTGDEKQLAQDPNAKVNVHKKNRQAAASVTPGADKSTPYYPCSVCPNYDAKNNECIQGIDVEKVQAAKACSWLNSNFKPFGDKGNIEHMDGTRDQENYKNDISQLPNSGGQGAGKTAASDKLKNIWRKI